MVFFLKKKKLQAGSHWLAYFSRDLKMPPPFWTHLSLRCFNYRIIIVTITFCDHLLSACCCVQPLHLHDFISALWHYGGSIFTCIYKWGRRDSTVRGSLHESHTDGKRLEVDLKAGSAPCFPTPPSAAFHGARGPFGEHLFQKYSGHISTGYTSVTPGEFKREIPLVSLQASQ